MMPHPTSTGYPPHGRRDRVRQRRERSPVAPLPARGGARVARLTLQLEDLTQPDRGLHVACGGAGFPPSAPEAFGARCRRNLTLAHKLRGIKLSQESMHAELLHPRRRAFDAIGIPDPERWAEVSVRRLLGLGRRVEHIAGQIGGAVFSPR